jgi:phage replication O-like protein O
MANPQKENGYTAIANELMEAFARVRIKGEARQIIDVIMRKTYGFKKKEDDIALAQFVLKTGLKKSRICAIIKDLCEMKVINARQRSQARVIIDGKLKSCIKTYSIQKDYDKWELLPKKVTRAKVEMLDNVPEKGKNT